MRLLHAWDFGVIHGAAAQGFVLALVLFGSNTVWGAQTGQLEIRVVDKETGEPVAVRMHLKDARGKPVQPPNLPFWKDHFVFGAKIVLDLPLGHYTFEIEHGPEYRDQSGYFIIERDAADTKIIEMTRFVDLKKEGWWSGDLHIHRLGPDPNSTAEMVELLMLAEDLHVAPVITWWNDKNLWTDKKPKTPEKKPKASEKGRVGKGAKDAGPKDASPKVDRPLPNVSLENPLVKFGDSRFYQLLAGEDEREGGALLYFNVPKPLPISGAKREFPSPVEFLRQAKEHEGVHVDIEKPFWWDVPVWIATRKVDSIGIAHNHMHRDGVMDSEAWGKPRDKTFYPGVQGNGRWTQAIYYHLLNCGLRIPPSAGSASGVLPNPVGYNRVYVHVDGELTWEKWWQGLRAGRVFVTNGPLLRPRVNGELPGYVFTAYEGETVELNISLDLAMRDKVEYLEVVKNGEVIHDVRLDEWAKKNGEMPTIKFDASGWLMIRAVTNSPKTYRFAATGPYYVEIAQKPRISRKSAQFFVDWVTERARRIKLEDATEQAEVMKYHRAARDYWQGLVDKSTAD